MTAEISVSAKQERRGCPAANGQPTTISEGPAVTKQRIMNVAMMLFGERGVDRVTLQEISDAAGSRNKSAVGYHFVSKQGLVDALLQRIERDVGTPIAAALSEIETRLDSGMPPTVGDVVRTVFAPVVAFYVASPYGRAAFRLLARLMHDPVDGIPAPLRREAGTKIARFIQILHRLQPAKPPRLVEQHVHHSIMATINGLSLTDRFLAGRADRWSAADLADFFDSYVDFLAGGLSTGAPGMGASAGTPRPNDQQETGRISR